MNRRIVIMIEEPSMEKFLRRVLPKAFPGRCEKTDWLLIPHRGKTDLESSFPKKFKAWREPNIGFLVARDNDGADCQTLKKKLIGLVPESPRHSFLIRIVCQELEAWMLGDPDAVAAAYPAAARHPSFRKWTAANPDEMANAGELLAELTGTRAKILRADSIARHIEPARNRSHSFRIFLSGLSKLFGESV